MNPKEIILIIIMLLYLNNAHAQAKMLKSKADAELLSQTVSKHLVDSGFSDFFNELLPYWPIKAEDYALFKEKTTSYFQSIPPRLGNTIDAVKIREEVIKDFGLKEVYLLRFQKSAIRLIYIYYRNNDGWIINSFKCDENFSEEFHQ